MAIWARDGVEKLKALITLCNFLSKLQRNVESREMRCYAAQRDLSNDVCREAWGNSQLARRGQQSGKTHALEEIALEE